MKEVDTYAPSPDPAQASRVERHEQETCLRGRAVRDSQLGLAAAAPAWLGPNSLAGRERARLDVAGRWVPCGAVLEFRLVLLTRRRRPRRWRQTGCHLGRARCRGPGRP